MTNSGPRGRLLLWSGVLVASVGVALLVMFLVSLATGAAATDFAVYVGAVRHLLETGRLYDYVSDLPGGVHLGFTYPPFAALVMLPIAWLPDRVGLVVWALVQLVAAGVAVFAVLRGARLPERFGRTGARLLGVLGWLAVVASAPVLYGLAFGQISLVVVVLVVVDQVLVPPRWRGWLTGLAISLKLTPAVFLLLALVLRQWRVAAQTAAGAVGGALLAFLVLPGESWAYWTYWLWRTDRVGVPSAPDNHSLLGVLAHWFGSGPTVMVLWLVLALVVLVLGLRHARRLHLDGQLVAATLSVGMVSVVVSPVSWIHHLAWLPLIGVHLAATRTDRWRWVGLALLVAFLAGSPLGDPGTPARAVQASVDLTALLCLAIAVLGVGGSQVQARDP